MAEDEDADTPQFLLRESVLDLVEGVGGRDCVETVGYLALTGHGGVVAEHRFYVIVEQEARKFVIGTNGRNADRIRDLLRVRRLAVCADTEVDMRVISREDQAPAGTVWSSP